MRLTAWPALALFLAAVCLPLRADRVLFIGNSFTIGSAAPVVQHNGGVAKLFEAIAQAKGRKAYGHSVASGGKSWAWHLAQPRTADALAYRVWDWGVLQDESTRPTHTGNVAAFMRDGETFSDRIAVNSPHAGLILFETWARPQSFYGPRPGHDFAGPAQMLAELHQSYARLRDDLAQRDPAREVRVALVGTAFARCQAEFPAINLTARDNHHSTPAGYYLAALVIYETIYHQSVAGAPAAFFHGALIFPPDVAADLQRVADEVTLASKINRKK
jgi:hypothetical protein